MGRWRSVVGGVDSMFACGNFSGVWSRNSSCLAALRSADEAWSGASALSGLNSRAIAAGLRCREAGVFLHWSGEPSMGMLNVGPSPSSLLLQVLPLVLHLRRYTTFCARLLVLMVKLI